jgi:hypothetical protein
MSVIGMTAARAVRSAAPTPRVGPSLAAGPPDAPKEDVLTQLLRYTPTEVVGVYVGVIALLPTLPDEGKTEISESDFTWRWLVFILFFLFTPLTILAANAVRSRAAGSRAETPWFEMIMGPIAFAAWALALPLSPMFSFSTWSGWMGVVIATIVLFLIGIIAKLAGKALPKAA